MSKCARLGFARPPEKRSPDCQPLNEKLLLRGSSRHRYCVKSLIRGRRQARYAARWSQLSCLRGPMPAIRSGGLVC